MDSTSGCNPVEITLANGEVVYPVQVQNRATHRMAYLVSKIRAGGVTLTCSQEVDEAEMITCVRSGSAVRAANAEGLRHGQYRLGGSAVVQVRIDGVLV